MSRDDSMGTVIAALDRAEASPYGIADALVQNVGGTIIGEPELFVFAPWTAVAVRAIVLTLVENAPSECRAQFVRNAKHQIEWLEWWDREGRRAAGTRAA